MSRWNFKNLFTSNGDGVCGCKLKPSDVSEPIPKPVSRSRSGSESKPKTSFSDQASSSSSTSSSWEIDHNIDDSPEIDLPKPLIDDSLAVVKDSDDPYTDFRQSMLQMIVAKQIYSRSELRELLRCFLELNSPRHHKVIVRAFIDIWNGGEEETTPCSST